MSAINLDSQVIQNIGTEIATLDRTLLQRYFPELEAELSAIASNVKGEELHGILNSLNSNFSIVQADLFQALPKLENFLEEQIKTYNKTDEQLDSELLSLIERMNNIVVSKSNSGAGAGSETIGSNGGAGAGSETTPETTEANGGAGAGSEATPGTAGSNDGTGAGSEATPGTAGSNDGTGAGSEANPGTAGSESASPDNNQVLERIEALERQNAELIAQNKELSKSPLEKANDEFLREAGADNAEFGERFTNDWSNVGEAYQDGLVSGLWDTLGATLTTAGNSVKWTWNQAVNCAEWGLGTLGAGKGTIGDFAAWLIS